MAIMAINLALAEFKPRVVADKVSLDDYDVTNLISSDAIQHRNGFMCERFVRTPVNITFHFPFNIEIYTIVVNTAVGAQRSTGLEIFTHSIKERKQTWFCNKHDKNLEKRAQDVDKLIFNQVGKLCHQDLTSFHFVNNSYKPRHFGKYGSLPVCPQGVDNAQTLNAKKHFYLSNVTYLTVRIIQTASASIPCLKSVQIWGQPALGTNIDIIHEIFDILSQRKLPVQASCLIKKTDISRDTQVEECESVIDGIDIPQDFIDPITCDLMSLPIMLPSGYTIDQSTLDKHTNAEEKWGRSSTDPFTGLRFSSDSKPVVNFSLKARIDQFVLSNSGKLKTVPRSLGSQRELLNNKSSCKVTESSLLKPATKRKFDCEASNSSNDKSRTLFERKKVKSQYKSDTGKRCSTQGSNKVTVVENIDLTQESDNEIDLTGDDDTIDLVSDDFIDLATENEAIDLTEVCDNDQISKYSHENKLKSSLNSALDGALSNLPSFTKKKNYNSNTAISVECLLCESHSHNMYSMPCGKFVCRPCLTNNVNKCGIYCSSCFKEHPSSSIQKIHL